MARVFHVSGITKKNEHTLRWVLRPQIVIHPFRDLSKFFRKEINRSNCYCHTCGHSFFTCKLRIPLLLLRHLPSSDCVSPQTCGVKISKKYHEFWHDSVVTRTEEFGGSDVECILAPNHESQELFELQVRACISYAA